MSEKQTTLDLSLLPKHVSTLVEDTILDVTRVTPTERELEWSNSPGEMLLSSFFKALEARQKSWVENGSDPAKMFYETLEIKSLALSPSLRGVEIVDLCLPFLFTDYQLKKTVPYMQRKLLDIYGRSPELARDIVDMSIVGGHGTRSGSLVNIFSHGLRPTDYQKENQLASLTGNFDWNGNNFNRVATSQCLWWNDRTITRYAHRPVINIVELEGWMDSYKKEWDQPDLKPFRKLILSKAKEMHDFLQKSDKSDNEKDIETCLLADFPVVVLVDDLLLNRHNVHTVKSDEHDEFAADGGVAPENIPVILVPSKDMMLARKIGTKYGWYGRIGSVEEYNNLKEFDI